MDFRLSWNFVYMRHNWLAGVSKLMAKMQKNEGVENVMRQQRRKSRNSTGGRCLRRIQEGCPWRKRLASFDNFAQEPSLTKQNKNISDLIYPAKTTTTTTTTKQLQQQINKINATSFVKNPISYVLTAVQTLALIHSQNTLQVKGLRIHFQFPPNVKHCIFAVFCV